MGHGLFSWCSPFLFSCLFFHFTVSVLQVLATHSHLHCSPLTPPIVTLFSNTPLLHFLRSTAPQIVVGWRNFMPMPSPPCWHADWLVQVLCTLSQSPQVHMCIYSVSGKGNHCFSAVTHHLWIFLQSFYFLFWDGPWASWAGVWYACTTVDDFYTWVLECPRMQDWVMRRMKSDTLKIFNAWWPESRRSSRKCIQEGILHGLRPIYGKYYHVW